MLLECRRTTQVEKAPPRVLEFWEWYGLTALAKSARKDWPWWPESAHVKDWVTDSVTISDEALALQVLHLRGDSYLLLKDQMLLEKAKPLEERTKGKGGRKRRTIPRGERPDSQTTLCETVDMYVKYYVAVKETRWADPDDQLGWNEYLKKRAVAKRLASESKGGKKKIIEIVDIPVDDVSFLTSKRSKKSDAGRVRKMAKV